MRIIQLYFCLLKSKGEKTIERTTRERQERTASRSWREKVSGEKLLNSFKNQKGEQISSVYSTVPLRTVMHVVAPSQDQETPPGPREWLPGGQPCGRGSLRAGISPVCPFVRPKTPPTRRTALPVPEAASGMGFNPGTKVLAQGGKKDKKENKKRGNVTTHPCTFKINTRALECLASPAFWSHSQSLICAREYLARSPHLNA